MPRPLKRIVTTVERIPMAVRIAACLLAAVAAVLVTVVRDDSSGARGAIPGNRHSSTYLGPREGGHTWVRSRARRSSVIWAIGDGADGGADSRNVAAMVASRKVDRFIYLGDVYETGTAREFDSNYRAPYSRFDAIAAPTIGNHEWPNVATGYVPYWTGARGTPPPFWYAFAASGWQLISLDSNAPVSTSTGQLGWLAEKIKGSPRYGNCRIAFMHHPVFSAGLHGDTGSLQALFEELEGRARIVLAGHDHDMQRLHPIDGTTQLVVGAGGRDLYPVNRDDPRLAFFDDTHHGALRIKLRPGRAVLSFLAEDGTILDRSTVACAQG